MSSVVEKLAAIEREVAAIQPKMLPLTERIADLDQKVAGFARQLVGVAEESAAVKQDIELTRQSLARIQTLIGESRAESEQLVAGQEENQQRCETMTAVFGAAFQAMSQFFETAQRMGIADQAKAVFLSQPSSPEVSTFPQMPLLSSSSESEPPEEPTVPAAEPVFDDTGNFTDNASEAFPDGPGEHGVDADVSPTPESLVPELQNPASHDVEAAESVLSESDFESAISDVSENELASWSPPDLPDVTAPSPEIVNDDDDSVDSESESDAEPSAEIASHLDVPPLNLSVPALPMQSEQTTADEMDEQEIEALLASMQTPVTAGN